MTEEEICREFRLQRNKRQAIRILRDLSLRDQYEIVDILLRHGEIKKPPKLGYRWTRERLIRLRELAASGMTQEQIGEAMGISRSSVDHKLRTLGLSTGKRHDPEVEEV